MLSCDTNVSHIWIEISRINDFHSLFDRDACTSHMDLGRPSVSQVSFQSFHLKVKNHCIFVGSIKLDPEDKSKSKGGGGSFPAPEIRGSW